MAVVALAMGLVSYRCVCVIASMLPHDTNNDGARQSAWAADQEVWKSCRPCNCKDTNALQCCICTHTATTTGSMPLNQPPVAILHVVSSPPCIMLPHNYAPLAIKGCELNASVPPDTAGCCSSEAQAAAAAVLLGPAAMGMYHSGPKPAWALAASLNGGCRHTATCCQALLMATIIHLTQSRHQP